VDSSILFGIQARRKGVSSDITLWQRRLNIEKWKIKFANTLFEYEVELLALSSSFFWYIIFQKVGNLAYPLQKICMMQPFPFLVLLLYDLAWKQQTREVAYYCGINKIGSNT
jgi:hypothetical protein